MKTRTQTRRSAFKALFEAELRGAEALTDYQEELKKHTGDTNLRDFALTLVDGVTAHAEELTAMIRTHATHWDPARLALTDRVILQMAFFEIRFLNQAPAVAITEAIELARRYGSADSPAFVNGVLDAWNRLHPQ